jgi:hypothetical protein
VAQDFSVHVKTTDGHSLLDIAATPATKGDGFGTPMLSPDAADLYYWQNVEIQANRGTLMHARVTAGATPNKIADKVSLFDVRVLDNNLLLSQNVDDLGLLGTVAKATARDGTGLAPLMAGTPVGGLAAINPLAGTWYAAFLVGAQTASNSIPIDGSPPTIGALHFLGSATASDSQLDAQVHNSALAFSSDGGTFVYVGGASFSSAANNYVGALKLLANQTPSAVIDGKLPNVSELTQIYSRSFFANTTSGVFYVSY